MKLSGARVLVTGDKGFVGSRLKGALEGEEANVGGFDAADGKDITDLDAILALEPVDIVFHLAAIVFVPYAWENPHKVSEVNVGGTLNTLEYCRRKDVSKVVFASSYIYGPPDYLPVDEDHPLRPPNPYARSKFLAEKLCLGYSQDYDIDVTILRPFNIYGSGQGPQFLIPEIITGIESGHVKLKDPRPKRDFLYIDDMIGAYLKAGAYDGGGIFNIGFGQSHSVDEVVQMAIGLSGKDVIVSYSEEKRPGEVMDVVANIEKARKELGWTPKIGLADGLSRMLKAENVI